MPQYMIIDLSQLSTAEKEELQDLVGGYTPDFEIV